MFFVGSLTAKAQTEMTFQRLQNFLSASGIDDVENDLRNMNYSFRQTVANADGTSTLIYQKTNSKVNAYELVVFFKKKSNVGFSSIRFMTYEEQQFYRLKNECAGINTLKAQPEATVAGCLERKYDTPQFQFQFKSCNNQGNGLTHYQIEILPHQ